MKSFKSFGMRVPVGILLISGMVVCMYLFGLLVAYKHREITSSLSISESQLDQDVVEDSNIFEPNLGTISIETSDILRRKIGCDNKVLRQRTYQRGAYWVLENYVVAERQRVNCYESVTYTTHTDYTFLDNLVPVVNRWRAPVSVSLYVPGDDFKTAAQSIFYMRNCLDNQRNMDLIREFVSFHLYFDTSHMPTDNIHYLYDQTTNQEECMENPMLKDTYKATNKLLYPVNVGRNIARDAAATHFVFPSDIELYPSPGIVPKFLQMIADEPGATLPKHRVFPIAIYEVAEDAKAPNNKTELVQMLKSKKAQRFHASICSTCHAVPESDKWESTPEAPEMSIFIVTKRTGKFHHWEPIYIGTREDPYYDERLSWEGKSDKMTQGYILCVLDYSMALLTDAFLAHRPGFKTVAEARRQKLEEETVALIKSTIGPELLKIYGKREGCNL